MEGLSDVEFIYYADVFFWCCTARIKRYLSIRVGNIPTDDFTRDEKMHIR